MSIQTSCFALAKAMNAEFKVRNKPISYARTFSDVGMLPGIARRANEYCTLSFGYGIGASFEDEERSMLGLRVSFDEVTPMSLRLLYIAEVLNELIQTSTEKGVTSLDELIY